MKKVRLPFMYQLYLFAVYGKDLIDYLRRVTNTELGELLLVFSCLREGKSPSRESDEHVTEAAQRLAKVRHLALKEYVKTTDVWMCE